MSEHTPRPWKAVQQASCPSFWWVADAWGKKVCGLSHSVRDEDKEAIANLLAAAPDLSEACEDLLTSLEEICSRTGYTLPTSFRKGRAAITKAEGGASAQ